MGLVKRLVRVVVAVLFGVSLVFLLYLSSVYYSIEYRSWEAQQRETHRIYNLLIAQTGQTQDALPLIIDDEMVDNAYNNGTEIHIYRGLIEHSKTWDEVALVLAHEIAHGMLGHLSNSPPILAHEGMGTNDIISTMEANADKLGSVYMMKAGFNICNGRHIMKRWKEQQGNGLGGTHPNYSYRYDELQYPWCYK